MTGQPDPIGDLQAAARLHGEATEKLTEKLNAAIAAGATTTDIGATLGVAERTARRWLADGVPNPWRIRR